MIRNININEIVVGWSNWALNQMGILNEEKKKTAETRLKICEICTLRKENKCGVCGCYLPAKTVNMKSFCPANPRKW